VTKVAPDDLKLKGAVKEIGIVRDSDRYDSFNVTIGIAIKTEGKVTYDEAEKLAAKFRREYLSKDVEFVAVSVPCPICGKVLNSETGLKKHISMNHPEKVGLVNSPKIAQLQEKSEKKALKKKEEKASKIKKNKGKPNRAKPMKVNKVEKAGNTEKLITVKTKRSKVIKSEVPLSNKLKTNTESTKQESFIKTPRKPITKKQTPKARQLTLS
jgi:hypothetical protein